MGVLLPPQLVQSHFVVFVHYCFNYSVILEDSERVAFTKTLRIGEAFVVALGVFPPRARRLCVKNILVYILNYWVIIIIINKRVNLNSTMYIYIYIYIYIYMYIITITIYIYCRLVVMCHGCGYSLWLLLSNGLWLWLWLYIYICVYVENLIIWIVLKTYLYTSLILE